MVTQSPDPPLVLTLSHLQSWQRCQRQYQLKHGLGYQWPRNESRFVLGKAVHKLLEFQARGLALEPLLDTFPPEIAAFTRLLAAHGLGQAPVVANEWAFHLPMMTEAGQRVWWTGRVDRIVRLSGGRVGVLDWKTGTAIPKEAATAWQTRLYLAAVWELRHGLKLGLNEHAQLVFVYAGGKGQQVRCVEVPYGKAAHEATMAELATITAEIASATEFALPPACPDDFCPYRQICGIQHTIDPLDQSIGEGAESADPLGLPEGLDQLF
jgi:PD-(D/E)XK nuclease superfamily